MIFLRCNYSYEKSFSEYQFWSFLLGNICFGVKGLQPMQKLKKKYILHVNRLISGVFIFYIFGLQPSSKPVRMLSQCQCLSVYTHNDILQFHCPQPTELLFLRNDALYGLCFNLSSCLAKSFKIPSDSMTYWWTKGHFTLFSPFPRYFC